MTRASIAGLALASVVVATSGLACRTSAPRSATAVGVGRCTDACNLERRGCVGTCSHPADDSGPTCETHCDDKYASCMGACR